MNTEILVAERSIKQVDEVAPAFDDTRDWLISNWASVFPAGAQVEVTLTIQVTRPPS